MKRLFDQSKVIICLGSGGVGKTTFSASLGYWAASLGKKVLVLTIDPSNRLATTMGLKANDEISEVKNLNLSGQLFASIVDSKKTFDRFIKKGMKNPELVDRLSNNSLYQQLTTSLSSSQDFTALERLFSEYESNHYDLIILDTPPSHHVTQFLKAPQKLAMLFSKDVMKWFQMAKSDQSSGFLLGMLQSGARQAFKVLEGLTGGQFVSELLDFFANVQNWQEKLETRSIEIHRLLQSEHCKYLMVTSFDEVKLREALGLQKELRREGILLNEIVINRAFLVQSDPAKQQSEAQDALSIYYRNFMKFQNEKENYLKAFVEKTGSSTSVHKVPEYKKNISDMNDIAEFVEVLKGC